MSYIQDHLMPREEIILSARVLPAVFLPAVTCFGLTLVLFISGLGSAPSASEIPILDSLLSN